MPGLFVDTSGWGNLVDPSQPFHREARAIYQTARRQGREMITTNYIVAELVALMSHPLGIPRPKAVAFIDGLRAAPHLGILHVDPSLDAEAWKFLKARPDKEWSLTDCVSFVVMQQRGIHEALASDHHFEQAGFLRLLKP